MKKLSEKAEKYSILLSVLFNALSTGEYKNPHNPRQMDPFFREELHYILDDIFAEEFEQIHMIADYERALLKSEMEVIKLKAQIEIERIFKEKMAELEKEVRTVLREFSEEDTLESVSEQTNELNEKTNKEIKEQIRENKESTSRSIDDITMKRTKRMNTHLDQIIDFFKP